MLLVPFDPIGRDISGWLYGQAANRPANLQVEWLKDHENGGGVGYVGTVEGIDVYVAQLPVHQSLVFSSRALRSITYATLPNGVLLDIKLDEGEDPSESPSRC